MRFGPHIDHYIGVYDNVFSEQECKSIIEKFEHINGVSGYINNPQHDYAKQSGDTQFNEGKLGRSDTSLFFEEVSQQYSKWIHEGIVKCVDEYKKTYLGLDGLPLVSTTCKIQRTGYAGGYHVWHSEHGGDETSMRRVLVWMLYLTTHEESGETEFLQQGIRIKPQAGRVVIWPASFTHPHRGNPVYDHHKYIATGWFNHYYNINRVDAQTPTSP